MIHLDFETYSPADLTEVGVSKYAAHPEAEILMAAVASETEGPFLLVNPKYTSVRPSDGEAIDLQKRLNSGEEVWAHNSQFEMTLSEARLPKDFGLPVPPRSAWRCTALLCRRAGIPSSLEKACETLGLEQKKDNRGKALIRMFSIPDKEGKRTLPQDKPEEFREFCEYCLQDVRAEMALHAALKPFAPTGDLLRAFQFDQTINARGFAVDMQALHAAQKIVEEADADVGARFVKETGLNITQRAKVQAWFHEHGLIMPNMQADTVKEMLDNTPVGVPQATLDVLKLYSEAQFAAVKKVKTMLDCAMEDGRVRGGLQFHGAAPGKWSGRLVQPQNFKKPEKEHRPITAEFYRDMKMGMSREDLTVLYGNPIAVMASSVRHFLAGPLLDADYNAVEARIALWLAGQDDVLELFRQGKDVYKWTASPIYNVPEGKIDQDQRQLGKVTILGCQYQMWWPKFQLSAKVQYGLTLSDEISEKAVLTYRALCYKVVDLWEAIESAVRNAINNPGSRYKAGPRLSMCVVKVGAVPFLTIKLPSGRNLAYPWPALEEDPRRPGKRSISFFGNITGNTWGRVWTFGGSLLENCSTGTAFDLMAYGSMNAEAEGFEITNLIHDQALADHKPGQTVEDFVRCLTTLPAWADGLPIKAEGKITPYYTK